ncbi:MAG: type II toxin-antitoxin system RelB/DinJ family antitoxin [Treponema sp.]|nr:type II toxin-antitoxin system RelB/DinJ family antitoxin [Treponema sp.]
MAKKIIEISVDESLAENAQNIYKKLGLDLDDAIKLFLNQTLLSNGLPFSLRLSPVEQTKEPPLIPTSAPESASSDQPAPENADTPSEQSEPELSQSEHSSPENADTPSGQSEPESSPSHQPAPEKTSIVDDEEENTDAPNHLFDGWNK